MDLDHLITSQDRIKCRCNELALKVVLAFLGLVDPTLVRATK